MKTVLLALMIPFSANAATNLSCGSSPVSFEITSGASIVNAGAKLRLVASGMLETEYDAVVDVVENALPPLAVVNIHTLDAQGNENPQNSIHARIELALTDANALSTGKIQITKVPPLHPVRMRTRYILSGCTGNL